MALLPLLVPHNERVVDEDSPRAAPEAEVLRQGGKQALAASGYFFRRSFGRPAGESWKEGRGKVPWRVGDGRYGRWN